MERTRVSSGTEWESHAGYSRAVRAGGQVHVAGTTPVDDESEVVGDVCPAATMVEVARLVDEAFCIEVEATAVADD